MSRKKVIDFPEIGNISVLDYYKLIFSGKRATRNATKTPQGSTTNPSKAVVPKPSKKKIKKDHSSPYKKKKTDELVPPSPPEEIVKLKFLYGCV